MNINKFFYKFKTFESDELYNSNIVVVHPRNKLGAFAIIKRRPPRASVKYRPVLEAPSLSLSLSISPISVTITLTLTLTLALTLTLSFNVLCANARSPPYVSPNSLSLCLSFSTHMVTPYTNAYSGT